MSLDVYLVIDVDTGGAEQHRVYLFSANITHNLARMANEAGLYLACWRPACLLDAAIAAQLIAAEESKQWADARGLEARLPQPHARDLTAPLRAGLALLKSDPDRFRAFNAENGWGTYGDFVPWVEKYLAACESHPAALVEVSR